MAFPLKKVLYPLHQIQQRQNALDPEHDNRIQLPCLCLRQLILQLIDFLPVKLQVYEYLTQLLLTKTNNYAILLEVMI